MQILSDIVHSIAHQNEIGARIDKSSAGELPFVPEEKLVGDEEAREIDRLSSIVVKFDLI